MKILRHKLAGALLTVLLLCTVMTLSVSAAFNDVTDAETARALEILESFGIVSGYPDGGYHPDEVLSRAQFCKFAVLLLELEDQLLSASQRTLFSDVTSEHWAAAYVNLAYNRSLIQGYGNGLFGPDDSLTYEQAVTICLRILGYENSDIGTYYPDDQLRFADKLGLTASLNRKAGETLTRGEAARLLYSLLSCSTKKGEMYVSTLADRTVNSVILLDEHTTSPTGLLNCARFYSSGQAVWYPLAASLDASLIGTEGTALLNSDGALIGFLPGDTSYDVVDGILLSANYRSKNASGAAGYSVKLHTGSGVEIYPRANSISNNLVGSSGTLILNENSYATAFISDDSAIYNLTDEAILLSTNATSDVGITGCAEFRINGKSVWFRQSFSSRLSDTLIGSSGTVMYDDNDLLIDFLTDGTRYGLISGIYVKSEASAASFIVDGTLTSYPTAVSIASNQAGSSGTIMLNGQGYIISFTADSTEKYSIVNDAILLSSYASTGYSYGAKFYVNGKTSVYPYAASFSGLGTQSSTDMNYWYPYLYNQNLYTYNNPYFAASSSASRGILVLDSENCIVQFIPDGTNYRMLTGVLLNANTAASYFGTYVNFSVNGQTVTFPQQASISASSGTYGTLLLNLNGYAVDFIPDSSGGYSSSPSGILLSVGEIADDGMTVLAKMYINEKISTYAVAAPLDASYIGRTGKLMLDANGRAVSFMAESGNMQTAVVQSASASQLITADRTYNVSGNMHVIVSGSVSTWNAAYNMAAPGTTVTLYFNTLGGLTLIKIG